MRRIVAKGKYVVYAHDVMKPQTNGRYRNPQDSIPGILEMTSIPP